MAITLPETGQDDWGVVLNTAIGQLDSTTLKVDGDASVRSLTTNSTVRSAFLKTTSSTEHAATIYQAGTSGVDVAAALNVVSDNPQSSAMYVSGTETSRGTLKVTHRGTSAGADANAAALSIHLDDTAGGSAAQGIFLDGVTTGRRVRIRDNADADRFEINAAGNVITRAVAFLNSGAQVGSTSTQLGGAAGGAVGLANVTTPPSSSPSGGGVVYASAGQLRIRQSDGADQVVNNLAGGLVADGTTDNTTALAAAITATATGGTLVIPPGVYKGNIVITKKMTLVGYGVELIATAAGTRQLEIQSSDVTVAGFKFTGSGSGTYNSSSYGIYCKGSTYAARYLNISLRDLTFAANANHCVQFEFAENVNIQNVHCSDFARAAFMILSVKRFNVDRWSAVSATMPSGVTNAYGVALSRNTTVDISTQPRTSDFTVTRGYVADINWEGIDTHGGINGEISDCQVYHCKVGIAIVGSADSGGVSTFAPQNVSVDNCVVDSQVTDGSYDAGIQVVGCGTGANAFVELAGGCSVTNCRVINHGNEGTTQSGGIQVYLTTGVNVSGNYVDACSPTAIVFWHTNEKSVITGNRLRDFWSTSNANPAGISLFSTYNDNPVITGNYTSRGAKSATNVNVRGFHAVVGTDNLPILGINNFNDVTNRTVDNSQAGEARIEAKNIWIGINDVTNQKIGFRGVTPIVRPTAYTQTYSTATRTHAAYTADPETSAYTGAADGEAKLVDLNALRVAYENLRLSHESSKQLLNSVLDDLQSYGLLA